jgi:ATP diphosphatase
MDSETNIQRLLNVMARLRDPNGGCPWDLVQTFETIAPYTIEEAYEVADALENGTMDDFKEELGDLLMQVVFQSQIAAESQFFTFEDVAGVVADKMISRHPHVFGDEKAADSKDVEQRIWEAQKDKEKKNKNKSFNSILDDVTRSLPALMRAQKLQKRAARVGFEWPEAIQVLDKLEEEIKELRQAIDNQDKINIHEEVGDMLFCVVNLGRMLDVDCETSLRDCNLKFERRFKAIEAHFKAIDKELEDASLDEMEAVWQDVKLTERTKKIV